jgi:dihydropteroate synthase
MTVQLVGVLNLTPDSFSGDGLLGQPKFCLRDKIDQALKEGADWLDFGAQSTAPNATLQSEETELLRLQPLWDFIQDQGCSANYFSIDTFYHQVAAKAIAQGFGMINDVSGGRSDPRILSLIAAHPQVKYVMMYCKNASGFADLKDDQDNPLQKVIDFFDEQLNIAYQVGIKTSQLILDPGMGAFVSVKWEDSLHILQQIPALKKRYGLPIYIGASRKGYLGKMTRYDLDKMRLGASLAAALYASEMGAEFLRVHDVLPTKQLLEVYPLMKTWRAACSA